jgi:hypothetical protein
VQSLNSVVFSLIYSAKPTSIVEANAAMTGNVLLSFQMVKHAEEKKIAFTPVAASTNVERLIH